MKTQENNKGYSFTNDSPEMINACLNCKFPDCIYGACQALKSIPIKRQRAKENPRAAQAGWRYERFKALVDKGKPDNMIAIMLDVNISTVRRYHQRLIKETE